MKPRALLILLVILLSAAGANWAGYQAYASIHWGSTQAMLGLSGATTNVLVGKRSAAGEAFKKVKGYLENRPVAFKAGPLAVWVEKVELFQPWQFSGGSNPFFVQLPSGILLVVFGVMLMRSRRRK